jgi:hypothetical protein
MDRHTFVGTLTASLLAAPLAAEAQQRTRDPVVGLLMSSVGSHDPVLEA